MKSRARKFVLKPHHASVFGFLVFGLTLALLSIPLRALLNRVSIPEFTSAVAYGGTGSDAGNTLDVDAEGNQYVAATFNGTITIGGQTLVSHGSSDVALFKRTPGGTIAWAVGIGGTGIDGGGWVDADNAGGIYLGIWMNGNFDIGATPVTSFGSNDAVLAKFDAETGALSWSKNLSSARGELTEGIAAAPGGGVIWTGTFYNTAIFGDISLVGNNDFSQSYIAKMDASGDDTWVTMGSSTGNSRATGIAFLPDGNIAVSGQYAGTLTYGALNITSASAATDGYVVMLNSAGDPQWLVSYGGAGTQTMGPVFADQQGRLYGRMNYTAPDAVTLGTTTLTASGSTDSALFRINPTDGSVLWAKGLAGTSSDIIYFSTQPDVDGYGLVVTFSHGNGATYDGTTYAASGTNDVEIASLDPATGSPLWVSGPYGSADVSETMRALTWDGTKYYFTGATGTATYGRTSVTSAGSSDIWLGTLAYPNRNEYTAVPVRKPGVFSIHAYAQTVANKAVLYRYHVTNEGESPIYGPVIKDRSCPVKSVFLGRGDTNQNTTLDPGEAWDLFCLKKTFPIFPRTVTTEGMWSSSIISAYTVVDNEDVPFLDPVVQRTEGPVTLSVFTGQEGTDQLPSLVYVLQTSAGAQKPVLKDAACPTFTALNADKDGTLKPGETWIYLCDPVKDAVSSPTVTL